jgi:hypothetical protein
MENLKGYFYDPEKHIYHKACVSKIDLLLKELAVKEQVLGLRRREVSIHQSRV